MDAMKRSSRQTPSILAALLALALLPAAGCRPSEPEGPPAESGTAAAPAPAAPAPQPALAPPPGATSDLAPTSDLGPAPAAPEADAPLPQDRPLRAAFLVVNGVYNSELAAPFDVLQHTRFHVKPGIEPFTVSPDGQPVTTAEGIRIAPAYSFQNAPQADILVVPGTTGSMDRDAGNQALVGWVRQAASGARHVVALGDGAFVLAQAGLLDGAPATTFSEDYKGFAQRFPRVDLRINVSYVDAGKALTSQGGARSYDVAMHLVDRLYGVEPAKLVGQGLLIPWPPRPGTVRSETSLPPTPSAAGQPAVPGQ